MQFDCVLAVIRIGIIQFVGLMTGAIFECAENIVGCCEQGWGRGVWRIGTASGNDSSLVCVNVCGSIKLAVVFLTTIRWVSYGAALSKKRSVSLLVCTFGRTEAAGGPFAHNARTSESILQRSCHTHCEKPQSVAFFANI